MLERKFLLAVRYYQPIYVLILLQEFCKNSICRLDHAHEILKSFSYETLPFLTFFVLFFIQFLF